MGDLGYARAPRVLLGSTTTNDVQMPLTRYIDQIAIALSAVCIVHCLAVPLLVAILPVIAVTFGPSAHFHELMLWLVVPTSLVGLVLGMRVHKRKDLVLIGGLGMLLVALAALYGHDAWARWLEVGVSIVGSLVLASAHWQNFREVRRCHRHV